MYCRDNNLRLEILRLRYNEYDLITSKIKALDINEDSNQSQNLSEKHQNNSDLLKDLQT